MANTFHYNQYYIGRLFKNQTGKTVSEYINEQRVSKVKSLLLEENSSIANCALSVGFENVNYFNRVFKKNTGLSPSEFIRNNKGKT